MTSPTPPQEACIRRHHLTFLGQGERPMLFCHGFGTDQSMWRLVAPHFVPSRRVVLMDLAGSGDSDPDAYRRETHGTLEGHARDVADVCRAFDLRELVFLGHSVGGMIGLLASLQAPERFRALVMLGASARYLDDGDYRGGFREADVEDLIDAFDANRAAWADRLATQAMGNPQRPELAGELRLLFQRANPSILRHFARVTFTADCRAVLPLCRPPVLLLQAQDDVVVPMEAAHYLRDHLPDARLTLLEAQGHFAQLSAPGAVAAAIQAFLEAQHA
jgi:sigma-B regulation protein RsbQ